MDGFSRGASSRLVVLTLVFAWLASVLPSSALGNALPAGRLVVCSGDAPDGMNFAAEVREAFAYLSRDSILGDVLSYAARLEILYTAGATRVRVNMADRSAIVFFNPRRGIRLRGRRIQSPALVLAHELAHVQRALRGIADIRNGRFTSAEETAVIREIEQRVARLAGEPVRHAYVGTPVRVDSVTLGRTLPDQDARLAENRPHYGRWNADKKKAALRRP